MRSKRINHKKLIEEHEILVLAVVIISAILIGSFVFARPNTPQCSDKIDNDGDGQKDYPADLGCTSKRDTSEWSSAACDDGLDNDGDGKKDYPLDTGCTSLTDSSEYGTAQCDDGIDNTDADTLKDYPADPGCTGYLDNLETDGQCDDRIDNDGDTKVDYPTDSGCAGYSDTSEYSTAQCDDGLDNDADGKIDYPYDTGCMDATDNDEFNPPHCSDGLDNDGDTYIDYPNDPGCSAATDTNELSWRQCDDGIDNDGDGKIDYPLDIGCVSLTDLTEQNPECSDTLDNDGDTYTDYPADTGCANSSDYWETGLIQCDDGNDNDGDGKFDYPDDTDCTSPTDTSEYPVEGIVGYVCSDGLDNDADGKTDYPLDSGCSSSIDNDELDTVPIGCNITCSNNAQCGTDGWSGNTFCGADGQVYRNYIAYTCNNAGTCTSYCSNQITAKLYQSCTNGCSNGQCSGSVGTVAECSDGIDNDGDTFKDYPIDLACSGANDTSELGVLECDDGLDNDGDGVIDYPDDPGCTLFLGKLSDMWERGQIQCDNGRDDDSDGTMDYPADSDCTGPADSTEYSGVMPACSDGLDNDGDGAIDYYIVVGDVGCTNASDTSEKSTYHHCDDGIDNDGDTYIDYPADPGCLTLSQSNSYSETAFKQCDNSLDDDRNGLIDSKDSGCTGPTDTLEGIGNPPGFTRTAIIPWYFTYQIFTKPNGVDFDSDGKPEFILAKKGNGWEEPYHEFYESSSNGGYAKVAVVNFSGEITTFIGDVGDSDNDGLKELLVYGRASNEVFPVRLIEQATTGTYPTLKTWEISTLWHTLGARIDDGDNDGKKEIIFGGTQDNMAQIHLIQIYENTGNNAYTKTFSSAGLPFHTPQCFEVLDDVDGDGKKEMLFGGLEKDPVGAMLYLFETTGDNNYAQTWSYNLKYSDGEIINCEKAVYAGDTDGDGKKELVVGGIKTIPGLSSGEPFYEIYYVFEATGDNTYQKTAEFKKFAEFGGDSSVHIADIDNDGKNDIIINVERIVYGDVVYVYKSDADNHYIPLWEYVWRTPGNVAIYNRPLGSGDFDNDGKKELVFNEYFSYTQRTIVFEKN